ncbi:hypothetical protein B0H19DRAFT_1074654 [Mycena capillaripes]|nr:hypothetical protein B0H19DRAFT_1074654 [Mycena capillaripes]
MAAREVHDLSNDDPPFNPALWIGQQRKFPPKGKNFEVHTALEEALKIPPHAPTTSVDCLLGRPIPSSEILKDLSKIVGQAWLDGYTSIRDPRFNDGRDRLPLGALTLWKELEHAVKDQKMWQSSREWTDKELAKPGLDKADQAALATARSLLDTIGRDTKIFGEWTTFDLSIILSNAWLSDDHIDMMMADLSARVVAAPELAQKVMIAPLAFSQAIKDTPLLARYENHIKSKGLIELHFPLHIHGNHWIAGKVDFKQHLIGTADIFGEALWEQKHAAGARATCFIRLAFVIPKAQLTLTPETPAEISVAVAIGDHNFPDLAEFALQPPTRQRRLSLADLMNPAPESAEMGVCAEVCPTESQDVLMTDVESASTAYSGDHGDLDSDASGEISADEDSVMDVDVETPTPQPARKNLYSYFGGKAKAKSEPSQTKGKRSRNADSDLDESVDVDAKAKKPKKANGMGTSRSAVSAQKTRDALKAGELTVATADPTRYKNWQNTLRNGQKGTGKYADPNVKFHPTEVKQARHSLCGKWVTMGEVYEAGRWNYHFKSQCSTLHPGKKARIGDGLDGVPTLKGMGWGGKASEKVKNAPSRPSLPCPGITASTCPRLPEYFMRPGAAGGGARSATKIAQEVFKKMFKRLSNKQKEMVADVQRHEWKWIKDHAKHHVFSTTCKKQRMLFSSPKPTIQTGDSTSRSRNRKLPVMALTCANIALSVDEDMRVKEFEQVDEELDDNILGEEYMSLQDTFDSVAAALPAVQLPSESSRPSANMALDTLDFKVLVRLRKQHQTRQAANSARVKSSKSDEEGSSTPPVEFMRRQILRRYHELLKEDQSKAVGTAVERQARWSTEPKPTAGNTANAAAAATAVATKAAARRTKLFRDAKLAPPLLEAVKNARLTHFKPLVIGNFGIIWTELGLRVGREILPHTNIASPSPSVDALYSKGGGKNGKHGAIPEHSNISAFSYINVQVYELAHARTFRAYPKATSRLQTYQFRQLPPFTFLCRMSGTPAVNPTGIELTHEDANLFKELNSAIACFDAAVKLSRSRKKAKELDAVDAEEEDTTLGF